MNTTVKGVALVCILCACPLHWQSAADAQAKQSAPAAPVQRQRLPGAGGTGSQINEVFFRLLDTSASVPRDFLEQNIQASSLSIKGNPKDAQAYIVRGLAFWRMEDFSQASANLEKAFEIAPAAAAPGMLRILAECLAEQGKNDKAISVLTKAISMGKATDILYLRRAQAYSQAKNYTAALVDAEKVVAMNPHKRWALELRGALCLSAGKYENAVRDLTACIKLSPAEGRLYADRARAYDALGKKDQALADRKKRDSLNWNLGY